MQKQKKYALPPRYENIFLLTQVERIVSVISAVLLNIYCQKIGDFPDFLFQGVLVLPALSINFKIIDFIDYLLAFIINPAAAGGVDR